MSEARLHPTPPVPTGYSSRVRLDLIVDGRTIPLAKMAHDRVVLAAPTRLQPGDAEMVLFVDGVPQRWAIEILPHEPNSLRVPIQIRA